MKLSRTKNNFFDGSNHNCPEKLMVVIYFSGQWQVQITYKKIRDNGSTQMFKDTEEGRQALRNFINTYFSKEDVEYYE